MKQETPRSNRFHIGIFGQTNSGKSSLLNALVGQQVAIVSDVAGTTTDVVQKNMELPGVGPCVFLDTAGFDDHTELGTLRQEQSRKVAMRVDLALFVVSAVKQDGWEEELRWKALFDRLGIPVLAVLTQCDRANDERALLQAVGQTLGILAIPVSAKTGCGLDRLRGAIASLLSASGELDDLTGSLVHEGDTVLLVMPQDIQAPKGRLILPQVQVIRELLDRGCIIHCCTPDVLTRTLDTLAEPPALIITDSQVFKTVYDKKPEASRLTSFSVLLAAEKGNISRFAEGADGIGRLRGDSKVLIAEACAHAPLTEDIGREKIPAMLRQFLNRKYPGEGDRLQIEVVSGTDFPEDLSPYSLVIHCGACMFNRAYVLARQEAAAEAGVPMTNYGITIAWLNGILDKVTLPQKK